MIPQRSHFLRTRKWPEARAPLNFPNSKQDMVLTPTGLRFRGKRFPCTIGRGGSVKNKHEGDGGTPVGLHHVVGIFFRPDRMNAPSPWAVPIHPGDLWCDAPDDPNYNQLTRAPFRASHETMHRGDALYDIVLITDWNYPQSAPGQGSAIFLHRWRSLGYPTEGCIALRPDHLRWIVKRLRPGNRLLVP